MHMLCCLTLFVPYTTRNKYIKFIFGNVLVNLTRKCCHKNCQKTAARKPFAVADPGFPHRGGHGPCRGAWTPKAVTFQKFCMSKWKNLDPWGACTGHAPA